MRPFSTASIAARFGALLAFGFILFSCPGQASAVELTVGAGWSATTAVPPAFFWSTTEGTTTVDGPFTFSSESSMLLRITDDFCPGDEFKIISGTVVLGTTSAVEPGPCVEQG